MAASVGMTGRVGRESSVCAVPFIAATLRHAAALRGVPGGGVLPAGVYARFGGQDSYGHNQQRDRDEDNVSNCRRDATSPPGCTSSTSKQAVYPSWLLPENFTWADSTPTAGGSQRQLQGKFSRGGRRRKPTRNCEAERRRRVAWKKGAPFAGRNFSP